MKKKIFTLGGGLLLTLLIISVIFGKFNNKSTFLDDVTLKDSVSSNSSFAIYVENESGDYTEYSSNEWPTDMVYNSELSGCIDSDGNTIEDVLSYFGGKVSVKTSKSTYCYLYFDIRVPDIEVTTTVDWQEASVPVTGAYTITASTGSYWNSKYRTLNITSVSSNSNSKYTLEFITDSSTKTNFRDYIVGLLDGGTSVTSGTGYLVDEGDAGYRYEGQNPNNYVWYNNELWRIIGVIPTLTEDGYENLVKIIRVDSLGGYAYDGKSSGYTNVWGENTLYTILNSYYWGAIDGTGTDYCKGHLNYDAHCDFTARGIDSNSYYGSMVEYVYWNTGASSNAVTPSVAYTNETATQTVSGYIGLMNASDYGYAYYSTDHSTIMSSYTTSAITLSDWLYGTGSNWTMTAYTTAGYPLLVSFSGSVLSGITASYGYAVRPVLYLKSADVYIAEGSGSETDPYIIGIE